jgi:hypothetical protein
MTRKDSEKDAERPHYYSQFWLDVAAGRRVIGTPIGAPSESRVDEEADIAESEPMEPIGPHSSGRSRAATDDSDGFRRIHPQAVVEPEVAPEEEIIEPDLDEFDLADTVDDTEIPNIELGDTEDDLDAVEPEPEMDYLPEEEEEEEYFDDEEEEDDEWIGRGKKKPKPGRQVKPPKKPKRDTRRPGH